MKKIRQYFFIVLLLIATVILGYNYVYRPFEIPESERMTDSENQMAMDETKKTNTDIFASLTTQEKILQMIAAPYVIDMDSEELATVPEIKYGFFTLFGTEISMNRATSTITQLKKNVVYGLEPWIAVDHEGGSVQRLSGEGFSQLDSWQKICELDQKERQAELKRSAYELKDAGVDVVLGPVVDVGNNKILKDRVCSTTSYPIVADRGMDFTTIFSRIGVLPVLKHFPGIGLTTKDLHTSFDFVDVLENDVKLYKYIIDQNEKIGVMTSHAGVITQDKDIPCSVSPYCVSELNKAYPKVLVFTDALEMAAAAYDIENPKVPKDLATISKEAVLAGNDVLLYGQSVTQEDLQVIVSSLVTEYDTNPVFKPFVDNSVRKIIQYKYAKE